MRECHGDLDLLLFVHIHARIALGTALHGGHVGILGLPRRVAGQLRCREGIVEV